MPKICSLTLNVIGVREEGCSADQYESLKRALIRIWGEAFPLHHFTLIEPCPTRQGYDLYRSVQQRCTTNPKGYTHCGGVAIERYRCVDDYAKKFTYVRREYEEDVAPIMGLNGGH